MDMMDILPIQFIITQIDELIFAETGEHLDDLQYAILEGAVKQLKYSEIAKKNAQKNMLGMSLVNCGRLFRKFWARK